MQVGQWAPLARESEVACDSPLQLDLRLPGMLLNHFRRLTSRCPGQQQGLPIVRMECCILQAGLEMFVLSTFAPLANELSIQYVEDD